MACTVYKKRHKKIFVTKVGTEIFLLRVVLHHGFREVCQIEYGAYVSEPIVKGLFFHIITLPPATEPTLIL